MEGWMNSKETYSREGSPEGAQKGTEIRGTAGEQYPGLGAVSYFPKVKVVQVLGTWEMGG